MQDYLQHGITGIIALVVVGLLAPVTLAFIAELRASRAERAAMRAAYEALVTEHLRRNTDAMDRVRDGLDEVCRRLNGGRR